jgi:hypothetical protein
MKLRFRIPADFYVVGPDKGSLAFEIRFNHQGLDCVLTLGSGESLSSDDLPPNTRHFARAEHLILMVSEDSRAHPIWQWIAAEDWSALLGGLLRIANRCIRGIRNFGVVPGLRELPEKASDPEALLRTWRVEVLEQDGWRLLLPEPEGNRILAALVGNRSSQVYGELRAPYLPSIEEAIQDDLEPRPELEFTTNAIEHLRLDNHRFALLEAIIGLEIVLARFLKSYLRLQKGLSKSRIQKFLSPDLGLTARIAGVLDLVLTKGQVGEAQLEKVLSAINWRNTVIHRTGKLPDGLPEDTLRDGVVAVLGLTDLLAREAESIEAQPHLDLIAGELESRLKTLPRPSLRHLGQHVVGVWFRKVSLDDGWIPKEAEVEEIAETVGQLRKTQDRRFDPLRHLKILFQTIPGDNIVQWRSGQFTPLPKG